MAGSVAWKYTNYDDGKNNNCFGYEFYTDEFLQWYKIRATKLPEIHIFNKKGDIILDATTKYFPEQAKKLLDYDWEQNLIPPDYHFGHSRGRNFSYSVNPLATQFANGLADMIIREHNLTVGGMYHESI